MSISKMVKRSIIGILCFAAASSCGGSSEYLRSASTLDISAPIDYFTPVYAFQHDSIVNSSRGLNLVKYSNKYLDSLLHTERVNFNIGQKIPLLDQSTFFKYAEETSHLFEQVIREGSIENFSIPAVIDSLSKSNGTEYALLFYKEPVYALEKQQYPHISLGTGASLRLKQNDLYLMLLDIKGSEIAFFGKARRKKLAADLKELFEAMR